MVDKKTKSPPKWFGLLLQRAGTWTTQNEVAEACEINVDAVRMAFRRYGIEGEPFRNERNLIQLRYKLTEVKARIRDILREYDQT